MTFLNQTNFMIPSLRLRSSEPHAESGTYLPGTPPSEKLTPPFFPFSFENTKSERVNSVRCSLNAGEIPFCLLVLFLWRKMPDPHFTCFSHETDNRQMDLVFTPIYSRCNSGSDGIMEFRLDIRIQDSLFQLFTVHCAHISLCKAQKDCNGIPAPVRYSCRNQDIDF